MEDHIPTPTSILRRFLSVVDPSLIQNLPTSDEVTTGDKVNTDDGDEVALSSWELLYASHPSASTPASSSFDPTELEGTSEMRILVRTHPNPNTPLFSVQAFLPNLCARRFWTLMAESENRHLWDSTIQVADIRPWISGLGSESNSAMGEEARLEILSFGAIFMVTKARDMVLLSVDTRLPIPPSSSSSKSEPLRLLSASQSIAHPSFPPRKKFTRFDLGIGGFLVEDLPIGSSSSPGVIVTQISDLGPAATWLPSSIIKMVASTLVPRSLAKIADVARKMSIPRDLLTESSASDRHSRAASRLDGGPNGTRQTRAVGSLGEVWEVGRGLPAELKKRGEKKEVSTVVSPSPNKDTVVPTTRPELDPEPPSFSKTTEQEPVSPIAPTSSNSELPATSPSPESLPVPFATEDPSATSNYDTRTPEQETKISSIPTSSTLTNPSSSLQTNESPTWTRSRPLSEWTPTDPSSNTTITNETDLNDTNDQTTLDDEEDEDEKTSTLLADALTEELDRIMIEASQTLRLPATKDKLRPALVVDDFTQGTSSFTSLEQPFRRRPSSQQQPIDDVDADVKARRRASRMLLDSSSVCAMLLAPGISLDDDQEDAHLLSGGGGEGVGPGTSGLSIKGRAVSGISLRARDVILDAYRADVEEQVRAIEGVSSPCTTISTTVAKAEEPEKTVNPASASTELTIRKPASTSSAWWPSFGLLWGVLPIVSWSHY
ncbi:hypothetical protein CF319_g3880 [Tilletia indica]|nr:hypothetical protein CF319_g3880 [Tilletia indica]